MAKKSVKVEADKENKSLNNEDVEQSSENQENIDIEVVENTDEEKPESETNEQTVDFELKFNELNDRYLRLSAEYDNFRKRSLKEKMELIKTAGEDILLNILPVMDNFERALRSINSSNSDEVSAIQEGIALIYNNFKEFLAQRGVKEIDAVGKMFDTDYHEAITKIPAPQEDLKGKVIDVIEKGYLMHEKVIRFSKVVVGE